MIPFRNIFCLCVLGMILGALPCHAQYNSGVIEERLTELHIQCETAYLSNDFNSMKESIDIRTDIIQQDSLKNLNRYERLSHIALYMKDLGSYHYCIADIDGTSYNTAESYFNESLRIYEEELEDAHGASVIRTELAQMHYKQGEYDDAFAHLQHNRAHYYESGLERMELTTWAEAALCKARMGRFDEAICDIDSVIHLTPIRMNPLENHRKKGKILILKSEADGSTAKDAIPYFAEYFNYQKDSITVAFRSMSAGERERYWLRMRPFISDCFRLEDEAAGLVYDAALFSKSILLQFSGIRPDNKVAPKWTDIQARLKKNECAIEFVHYEKNGKMYLGAVAVHNEGVPKFFRISDLDGLMEFRLEGNIPVRDALNKEIPTYKNALYSDSRFNRIIWNKEICSYLAKTDKVYFAADGIFHKLAIEYIYPERNAPEFRRLTSTRELLKDQEAIQAGSMLICGGVDYFAKNIETDNTGNDRLAYDMLARQGTYFRPLKGAMDEVKEIFSLRDFQNDTLITGVSATETALRDIIHRYPYVSIATHGYYGGTDNKAGTDLKTYDTDYMLSQSVLIMAGAQRNLDNFDFDPEHMDGILSARELSALDLTEVKLMVVSACQSGLGKITPDGVFGIQRGLKNAGVESMIVSLWEVDDEATRYFMTNFHAALAEGKPVGESFAIARDCMDQTVTVTESELDVATMSEGEKVTTTRKRFNRPQYKNAFILIDNLL